VDIIWAAAAEAIIMDGTEAADTITAGVIIAITATITRGLARQSLPG
jgi:hypothetical protein